MLSFDSPAFVRRSQRTHDAWNNLLASCARERERLLEMPRMRLARWFALRPPGFACSSAICDPQDLTYLEGLAREWQPRLRSHTPPAKSPRELAHALELVRRSFDRFNRRWLKYVKQLDLERVNQLREGYNRYYVFEKECAVQSSQIARQGFIPLPTVGTQDLFEKFPLLEVGHEIGRAFAP